MVIPKSSPPKATVPDQSATVKKKQDPPSGIPARKLVADKTPVARSLRTADAAKQLTSANGHRSPIAPTPDPKKKQEHREEVRIVDIDASSICSTTASSLQLAEEAPKVKAMKSEGDRDGPVATERNGVAENERYRLERVRIDQNGDTKKSVSNLGAGSDKPSAPSKFKSSIPRSAHTPSTSALRPSTNGNSSRQPPSRSPTSSASTTIASSSNDVKSVDDADVCPPFPLPEMLSDFKSQLVILQDAMKKDYEEIEGLRGENERLRQELLERDELIHRLQSRLENGT
jgi:hypothetical protein